MSDLLFTARGAANGLTAPVGAVTRCVSIIYNRGIGPVKGAPNAWQLTARGRHVEQAIGVHHPTQLSARG